MQAKTVWIFSGYHSKRGGSSGAGPGAVLPTGLGLGKWNAFLFWSLILQQSREVLLSWSFQSALSPSSILRAMLKAARGQKHPCMGNVHNGTLFTGPTWAVPQTCASLWVLWSMPLLSPLEQPQPCLGPRRADSPPGERSQQR